MVSALRNVHGDAAREIAERFCVLCQTSGFAENFDAVTGVPLRDPAYTWTASVYLVLAQGLASMEMMKRKGVCYDVGRVLYGNPFCTIFRTQVSNVPMYSSGNACSTPGILRR